MIYVDIALRLVELRNKLGMSRTSFAKSIGITETHMKRFETGVAVPKEKHINTICGAILGVRPHEIPIKRIKKN